MSLREEIFEQPAALRRLLDAAPAAYAPIARELAGRRPVFAVFAARGSSDNAALYGQYLFGVRNRLPVALATPAALTLYGARPEMSKALVVGISQSGRSPDIVAVLDEARRQGALTVAVTNDARSPLATAAAHVIDIHAGPELATAATKTYTSQLLAVALLSHALDAPDERQARDLPRVPVLIEEALATEDDARRLASRDAGLQRCIVLGRGYSYATAREWALKLQELSQVLALPFSAADFEHGPLALIDPGDAVFAVAPGGPPLQAQDALLRRLRGELGARLLVLSDDPAARSIDDGIALPIDTPAWLSPLVEIVPAQLYAMHLTIARGLDPERPRTIAKITETR